MFCCFTGHRPEHLGRLTNKNSKEYAQLYSTLSALIEQSIADGYTDYYCGMARGIDTMAAEIILEKRAVYPDLKLHAALPCPNQHKNWPQKDKDNFEKLLAQCSSKTVISPIYTDSCMLNRNRFMVDCSQRVIAVWNGCFRGGTAFTVRYAKQRQREICLIRPGDLSVTIM